MRFTSLLIGLALTTQTACMNFVDPLVGLDSVKDVISECLARANFNEDVRYRRGVSYSQTGVMYDIDVLPELGVDKSLAVQINRCIKSEIHKKHHGILSGAIAPAARAAKQPRFGSPVSPQSGVNRPLKPVVSPSTVSADRFTGQPLTPKALPTVRQKPAAAPALPQIPVRKAVQPAQGCSSSGNVLYKGATYCVGR